MLKRFNILLFITIFSALLYSCNESVKVNLDANESKQKTFNDLNSYTLLQKKELELFLPDFIDGYSTGLINGMSNMTIDEMTYSAVDVLYEKEGGKIDLSITDYVFAEKLYSNELDIFKGEIISDNHYIKKLIFNNSNIFGWEMFSKDTKTAHVALFIGDRFFVSINISNQENTNLALSIAQRRCIINLINYI